MFTDPAPTPHQHDAPEQVVFDHQAVKAAARRAGLSDAISPHWFRHAHGSHSLDRGAPIHLVQQTLGHASAATTGRYLHARPTATIRPRSQATGQVVEAFEKAGLEFIPENGGGVGLRLKARGGKTDIA